MNYKSISVFILGLILYWANLVLNTFLGTFSVNIYIPIVYILFASILLPFFQAFLICIFMGFLTSSFLPVDLFGINAIMFGFFCVIINANRNRFSFFNNFEFAMSCVIFNTVLFVANSLIFSLVAGVKCDEDYLKLLAINYLLSSIFCFLISYWQVLSLKSLFTLIAGGSLDNLTNSLNSNFKIYKR